MLFGLYWGAYFALHSWWASLSLKNTIARRWPGVVPAYRLVYNLLALVLLIPAVLWIRLCPGDVIWAWTGAAWWLAQGLALLAVAGFFITLRDYDGAEFLGLRQWRDRESRVEDLERFRISPFHRFVRHPWYFLGLVLVWTRDMPAAWLVSAIAVTLYFFIGSRFEERKLLVYHGELYREYRRHVPALIPLPWRWLANEKARELAAKASSRAC